MTAPEQHDALQRAVGDAYTLESVIGQGGMGIVFRAHDNRHDRTVAIKMLRAELASSVGAARFDQEIRIEARLQHPNIVPVHEWAEREGIVYCVMPLVSGESLRTRLDRERQLPLQDALRIGREIGEALAYAHSQGIVHRDVKPENILLSSGHAMLADFGVARIVGSGFADRLTDGGLAVGTVAYMSPEQASADTEVGTRSDIYSLGCVVYEMLVGNPPFGSEAPHLVIARHLCDPPPPIRTARPTVPYAIAEAITCALEKSPADRYSSATEFASALELHTPSATRTPAARAQRQGRRRALIAVAVTGLVGGYLAWTPRKLDDARVVVLPLLAASNDSVAASGGWDVAIAISASLEHAEPLRVIDGYSYLSPEVRRDLRLLTATAAGRLARDRNARYYIDGAILRSADSTNVVLRLHDVVGDSLIAQESAGGGRTVTVATLGLRTVARLLPRLLDPTRRIDVDALTRRAPSAVALWIQGEREYRQSRFAPALDFFRRAVREDSALAIAAIRGAQAASWESRLDEASALAQLAVRHSRELPARLQTLAMGLQEYLDGSADSARVTLEMLSSTDHDSAEPAMALAEVHWHLLGGPAAPPDSAAEFWLREALRRDTNFTPPMFHLAEIAFRRREVSRGMTFVQALQSRGATPNLVRQLLLMAACVRDDTMDWTRAVAEDEESALAAAKALLAHVADPICGEAGLRALLASPATTPGVRWSATVHLQSLLVATRRSVELRTLLDSTIAAGTSQGRALFIIDAAAGADPALVGPKAAEAVAFAKAAYGEDYARASPQTRWVLGLWHALSGDVATLQAIDAVNQRAAGSQDRRAQLFRRATHAQLTLVRGDSMGAIAEYRALIPSARRDSLTYELFEPLAVERATLAELLLAHGAWTDAWRVAALLEHSEPAIYLAFLPRSLEIRARAAAKLRLPTAENDARNRLLALTNGSRRADRSTFPTRQVK